MEIRVYMSCGSVKRFQIEDERFIGKITDPYTDPIYGNPILQFQGKRDTVLLNPAAIETIEVPSGIEVCRPTYYGYKLIRIIDRDRYDTMRARYDSTGALHSADADRFTAIVEAVFSSGRKNYIEVQGIDEPGVDRRTFVKQVFDFPLIPARIEPDGLSCINPKNVNIWTATPSMLKGSEFSFTTVDE